jgi:dienelactone hydrolase
MLFIYFKLNAQELPKSAGLCKEIHSKYTPQYLMLQVLFAFFLSLVAYQAVAQELAKPINLPGPGSLSMKAWHFEPAQAKLGERRPVVIALHGCGGLYASVGARRGALNARHQAMGEMLAQQGYHTVFPDSFGSRGIEGVCAELQRLKNGVQVGMKERRADVLATLAWVRAQPWADVQEGRNNIALLGWSHGAQTLLAATDRQHAEVKAAKPFKTAIAFYPGCVQAQREAYRPNTALTLLLGADDDWTLPEPCIKLAQRLQQAGDNVTLKVYEGAVHDFDTPLPGIRMRSDVLSRKPGAQPGDGVKVGQNPAAREDAWQRVREILAAAFKQV